MRYPKYYLWILLILLAACRGDELAATPTSMSQSSNPPTSASTEPQTAATAVEEPTETPSVNPSLESTSIPSSHLPASTLFEVGWNDRSLFRAGLIDSEAGVLDKLPGATVYHMDIVLSSELTSISGRQEVRYTNQEGVSLDAVYYHLYPNLLGGRTEISAVSVNDVPVTFELQNQNSILKVPLESPLPPGGQVVIKLEFQVDVPTEGGSNYGVFATIDGVAALAHFYPQVAVYDDQGWDTDIPSANADVTYSDSSFYLVRITAPATQVLLTSGIISDHQVNGDNQILTVASGPTRDFYIASSDQYIVKSTTFSQTVVKSYGFNEFSSRVEQALSIAVNALDSYSSRFGQYPFTEFEVGPTPNLALGVEYPGVIVINSRIYDPAETFGSTPSGNFIEGTIAHEVGHQWFYSIIGNDQPQEPWVDESLTQYATYLYFVDQYGEAGGEGFRQSFVSRWDSVNDAKIPIGMPAGNYEGGEYSGIIYGRGPLFFETLSDTIGESSFNDFIRDYYRTYKWGIATGNDLKALAEAHCSCDLTGLFDEWVGDLQ